MRMNNDLLGKLGILSVAAVLASTSLTACKGDDTGSDDDETTGDGDGDPTGDGDGDPTGDGDGDPTGDGDGDGDPTGDGDGDGDPGTCGAEFEPGAAADGEACSSNSDCASYLCEKFQDVPPVEGTCAPAPDNCTTRVMVRVLDFMTRETVEGADLRAVPAISASVNPGAAVGAATGTSDANGIIDATSDAEIEAPLGLVGLTEADGYYLTATGLASPITGGKFYPPANTIRDVWVVPAQALTDWSGYLENDADFANQLPLGDAGGVIGLVRDATTGDPITGAVVVPEDADTSNAVVRYLNEAGDGFVSDATTSQGVFIIVKPGLGETFGLEVGGNPVDGLSGTAGSANGAAFTLIMNVPG